MNGENSVGEFYSVAVTNNFQQADTGTKMIHNGAGSRSTIISKGISAGKSNNTYRGLVRVGPNADGVRNFTQCDSLLLGDESGAHTVPYIEVKNPLAQIEHEATTSKISDDQLFYAMQRGLDEEEAVALIVNGFAKDVLKELPMEFAVEAQKLLAISLEGSVGMSDRKKLALKPPSEQGDVIEGLNKKGRGWKISDSRLDELHSQARERRRFSTEAHKALADRFTKADLGRHTFKRHAVVGSAIVDFNCHSLGMAVDIFEDDDNEALATRRDKSLEAVGIKVMRIKASEILENMDGVLQRITAGMRIRIEDKQHSRRQAAHGGRAPRTTRSNRNDHHRLCPGARQCLCDR